MSNFLGYDNFKIELQFNRNTENNTFYGSLLIICNNKKYCKHIYGDDPYIINRKFIYPQNKNGLRIDYHFNTKAKEIHLDFKKLMIHFNPYNINSPYKSLIFSINYSIIYILDYENNKYSLQCNSDYGKDLFSFNHDKFNLYEIKCCDKTICKLDINLYKDNNLLEKIFNNIIKIN